MVLRDDAPLRNGSAASADPPAPRAGGGDRWPELDGLRAVAVTLVFLYHAAYLPYTVLPLGAIPYVLQLSAGVELFFVLSGFLIYSPFARAHLGGHGAPDLRSYSLRRVLRVYPGYLVALGGLWALGWVVFERGSSIPAHLTLTQNYVGSETLGPSGIAPAWTLCVEVSFYAFVPVWAAAVRWVAGGRRHPLRAELAGAGALVVVGVLARWAASEGALARPLSVLLPNLPSLAGGMVLAVLVAARVDRPRLDRLLRRAAAPLACWAVAAVLLLIVPVRVSRLELPIDTQLLTALCHASFALLVALPVMAGTARTTPIGRILSSRPFVWTGLVSYGIYLWHYDLLQDLSPDWAGAPARAAAVAGIAAVSVGAGVLSYHLVERPVLDLVRRTPRVPSPPGEVDLRRAPP